MKKKGFTLIELLAVIIILAIIALITVPVIMNIIEKSNKAAFKDTAYGIIKSGELYYANKLLEPNGMNEDVTFTFPEAEGLDIKGKKPTSGTMTVSKDGKIELDISNGKYQATKDFNDTDVTIVDDKNPDKPVNPSKQPGNIKLSSNSGNYKYPNTGTFEVIENISGGSLSCKSSDESIAECSVSNNTVTVTPKNKEGSATLTIKSSETSSYTEATASHVVITEESLLSVTSNGYEGIYDGQSHGITVTSSGATIKYGTTSGTYNLTSSPTYINAGTYTVYYQVSKAGYKTVTGNKNVVINKANGSVSLSATSGEVYTGESITFTATNPTGDLSCTSSNTSIATCSISGTTITVTGVAGGSTTITVNVAASTNYNAISKTYSVIEMGRMCFQTNDGMITDYLCEDIKDVIIPNKIKGVEITSIGSNAFKEKGLTSVTIPNSVTTIEYQAFSSNQLTSITIPNSVKSLSGFDYNQLTSVIIPDSVTTIGKKAFSSNQLTSITIPNSVTNIVSGAFSSNKLTDVTIGNSVTSIGNSAFSSNQLTSITIPNGVEVIGDNAFYRNQLTSITIPNNVTYIGEQAFLGNQLTNVKLGNSVTTIGNTAFYRNQLTNVTIPSSVTSIGYDAFTYNNNVKLTIKKPTNSITGSPWGASSVEWTG